MSDEMRKFVDMAQGLQRDLDELGVTKPAAVQATGAAPAILDALDRILDRLVGMFDDDANNMPEQLLDDYLAARAWLDEQPTGWR